MMLPSAVALVATAYSTTAPLAPTVDETHRDGSPGMTDASDGLADVDDGVSGDRPVTAVGAAPPTLPDRPWMLDGLVDDRYVVVRGLNEAAAQAPRSGVMQVFEVLDREEDDRPKVLKLLPRQASVRLRRFYHEAQVLMRGPQHPQIPTVAVDGFFSWRPIDHLWTFQGLVMEAIAGEPLDRYLRRRGPVSTAEALRWWVQLSDILHTLHQSGWVHGDLKPANLIRRPDGTLVLIDFDAALPMGDRAWSCGSAGYMAPEQRRGDRVAPASDWFSLGRTLVHLLTGHHPLDLLAATAESEDFSWRTQAPAVPMAMAAAIDLLMAPNPFDRRMAPSIAATPCLLNLAHRLSQLPTSAPSALPTTTHQLPKAA